MEISSEVKIIIFVIFTILCTSKGQPLSLNSAIQQTINNKQISEATSRSYKIPTDLTDGTNITINGKLHPESTLKMTLSSQDKQISYCSITFIPKKKIIIQNNSNSSYNIHDITKDPIKFMFLLDVRSLNKDAIDMYFEGNDAGLHTLDPCEVDFLSDIKEINFEGIEHVNSLNFMFKEV